MLLAMPLGMSRKEKEVPRKKIDGRRREDEGRFESSNVKKKRGTGSTKLEEKER